VVSCRGLGAGNQRKFRGRITAGLAKSQGIQATEKAVTREAAGDDARLRTVGKAFWAGRGITSFRVGCFRVFVRQTLGGEWQWRVTDIARGTEFVCGAEGSCLAAVARGRDLATWLRSRSRR
jgi:hypothetical protein